MALPKRILKVRMRAPPHLVRQWSPLLLKNVPDSKISLLIVVQETERLMSDSPPGITAAPNEENLRHFDVTVAGPESSPYEGEHTRAS